MERLYRIALLALMTIGFLGAVASADHGSLNSPTPSKDLISLIKDVKVAQEANAINSNTWTQDVSDINENGLSKVEAFLSQGDEGFNTHADQ